MPDKVDKPGLIMSGVLGDVLAVVQRAVDEGRLVGDPAVIGFTAWSAAHGLTSLLISCPGMPWPDVDQLSRSVLARALQYPPERL